MSAREPHAATVPEKPCIDCTHDYCRCAARAAAPVPLIFAATMEQARLYAKKLGLASGDWHYLSPTSVRGRMNPVVYVVGTYYERPDYTQAMDALIPCHPTLLNEDGQDITL